MKHSTEPAAPFPVDPTRNVIDLVDVNVRRIDDLRELESRHVREVWDLRAGYDERLRKAEAARIDAIRKVDVDAVAAAAVVQASGAATLASTVGATAEASRATMAAAASAAAIALRAETDPLRKDIAELRQVQYETAGGKQQVVEGQASSAHWGLWIGLGIAGLAAFSTVTLGIVGIIVTLLLTL